MKKSIYLKQIMLVVFLLFGIKNSSAQCTITAVSSQGPNGVVSFTASGSTGTVSPGYSWYFPGSTTTNSPSGANAFNATATYTANGTYTVIVSYISGSAPTCSTSTALFITVTSVTNTVPTCTINVQTSVSSYTNTCTGAATVSAPGMCGPVSYTFSNGTTGSSVSGLCAGNYTVIANSVSGVNCCSVAVATFSIGALPPCNLNTSFTSTNITSNVVQFNNTTSGNTASMVSIWKFGDGTSSSINSPQHTYTATGSYTVKLLSMILNSQGCADSTLGVVNISTICVANAGFSLSPTSVPQVWNAYPIAPANVNSATWYWGDGSSSNTLYTSHTYSAAGNYSICLNVATNCGANATFCIGQAIYKSNQHLGVVTINIIDPSAPTGIKSAGAIGDFQLNILPNPNNGNFKIDLNGLPQGALKIVIYNVVGQIVFNSQTENTATAFSKEINLDGPSGIYFIELNANNTLLTKKIILTK